MRDELPAGWAIAHIGDVAHFVRGVTYSKANASKNPAPGMTPVLRANNIGAGLNFNDLVYVPGRFVSDDQIVRDGDVVLAMSSGSKSVVGKAAVAVDPPRCGFGAFCGVIRPNSAVNHTLLGYYFQTKSYRNAVSEISKGVNINNLKADHILGQPLRLPPEPEQKRLASKLDELFSRIDEGERALERVSTLVGRYRQSVLKAAVTGELTRDWREAQGRASVAEGRTPGATEARKAAGEPLESGEALLARILTARREAWEQAELARMQAKGITPKDDAWKKKYKEPAHPDTSDLPDLPEGWIWASVDQLCSEFKNGLSRKPANEPPGEPILRISAVRPLSVDVTDIRYYVPEAGESIEGFFVEPGDLLFTRYNGSRELVGVSGVVKGTERVLHPDKLIKARPVACELTHSDYLTVAMNSGASWQHITSCVKTSAGQHGIAGSDVKRAPVPIPSVEEQREIIEAFDHAATRCDELKATCIAELRRSVVVRQAVLKTAFAGSLAEQDPTDEPASALLERIATERAKIDTAAPKRGRKRKTK